MKRQNNAVTRQGKTSKRIALMVMHQTGGRRCKVPPWQRKCANRPKLPRSEQWSVWLRQNAEASARRRV